LLYGLLGNHGWPVKVSKGPPAGVLWK
jgi:hypothetical protein